MFEKITGWIITIILMVVIGVSSHLDKKKIYHEIEAICSESGSFTLNGRDYKCSPKRW